MFKLENLRLSSINEPEYKLIKEYFVVPELPELPDYIYKIKLREVPTPRPQNHISNSSFFEPQIVVVDTQTLSNIKGLKPLNYQYDEFELPEDGDYYWINFRTGEIVFNENLAGMTILVTYYGTGSLIDANVYNGFENQFRIKPIINHYGMTLKNTHEVYSEQVNRVVSMGEINYLGNKAIVYDLTLNYKPDSDYPMSIKYEGHTLNIIGVENNHIYLLWEDIKSNIRKTKILCNYTYTTGYDNIFAKILDYKTEEPLYIQFLFVKSQNMFNVYNRFNHTILGRVSPNHLFINDSYKLRVFMNVDDINLLMDGDSVIFKSRISGHTHDGIDSPRLRGYLNHSINLLDDIAKPNHTDFIRELDFNFFNSLDFNSNISNMIEQYEDTHKKITWEDIIYFEKYYPEVLYNWDMSKLYNINNIVGGSNNA
jgi:hypothetical protein